jgi:organic hydroperoxide reductase OsmC/OhrA
MCSIEPSTWQGDHHDSRRIGCLAGLTPERIDTTAKVLGADNAKFQEAARGAKENCPVSKLLNAKITMDAKLAS